MGFIVEIWNGFIIEPMINSLIVLYTISGSNFGIAIVLFTVIIRGAMMPLTVKQSRQMKRMTSLQPKIKEIQSRFSGDRQRQSQETMKLYKEQGVNPIGCLGPMFIQFPIWIGLYQAILKTVPAAPESSIALSAYVYNWIPFANVFYPVNSSFLGMDLADPNKMVMPILVGVSMWMMQKMTTMPAMDERQASTNKMMLWMMPIMFGFFTVSFPSGLALYWVISNIVGIIIQGFITGWDPIVTLLNFRFKKDPAPSTVSAVSEPARIERVDTNEVDNNHGKDSGRRDRDRSKRARRRPNRGRNRRR